MEGRDSKIRSQLVTFSRIDTSTMLCPSLVCPLRCCSLVRNYDVSVRCKPTASPKDLKAFFRPSATLGQQAPWHSAAENKNFHSHCNFLWSFSVQKLLVTYIITECAGELRSFLFYVLTPLWQLSPDKEFCKRSCVWTNFHGKFTLGLSLEYVLSPN